jgi:hypothetical protein
LDDGRDREITEKRKMKMKKKRESGVRRAC